MVSYLYNMPAGVPGAATRIEQCDIEVLALSTTNPVPTAYGQPVVLDATQRVRALATGDTAAQIIGLLVRPYPTSGGAASDALGTSTPPLTGLVNVMKRGYMNVMVNGAAPAVRFTPVFTRVAAPSVGKPIGGIEAVADATPANTLQLNATFQGAADSAGNSEIGYNL